MHLPLIIAVLAAMTIAEFAPREPVTNGTPRLLLALCGMAALTLFAAAFSAMIARALRKDFSRRTLWLRYFGQLKKLHVKEHELHQERVAAIQRRSLHDRIASKIAQWKVLQESNYEMSELEQTEVKMLGLMLDELRQEMAAANELEAA